jgi:CheY-like chemotaxis protein
MTRIRILIAEDNEADVYLINEALTAAGLDFESKIACNGEKVLALIDQMTQQPASNVDLIVLDLNLTTHGGIEILERIRQAPNLGHVPVVILTSSDSPMDRERAKKLGANAFIHKSMDLDEYMKAGREIATLLTTSQSVAAATPSE